MTPRYLRHAVTLAVALAAAALVAPSCANAARAAEPTPEDLSDLPWLDPEEASALLSDLEEAGLVPTDLDLRELGLGDGGASDADVVAAARPAPARTRARPAWTCRLETRDDGRARAYLDGSRGPWNACLRAGRSPEATQTQVGGCVWADQDRWSVVAGGVGAQHGLGLYCAGPGRARAANLAASLNSSEGGLRHWGSADAAGGVRGVAAQGRCAGLTAGALAGRLADGTAGDDAARAAWLAWTRDGVTVSCLASPGAAEAGRSLAVRIAGPRLDLQAERADWTPAGGVEAAATAAAARWRERRFMVEGLIAAAAAPNAPRLGSRPACLIGWDGHGWAVRSRVAVGTRLAATLLAAGAADRPTRTRALDRDLRHQVEVGLAGPLPSRGSWSLRWRRREDDRWSADEEAPWLPAQRTRRVITETMVAEAALVLPRGEVVSGLRCVERDDGTLNGRRLVATVAWRSATQRVRWVVGGGWAWGDPVAVTTVSTPAAGLAVPRSWSAWDAEAHVGADASLGPGRLQIAVARRTPSPGTPEADSDAVVPGAGAAWEGWLRLVATW